ncbi:S8 family serine peptidase [Streptomyces sp. NBC_00683]|uniref:S8 family serine peptidase n=1 Tax=Streptomyces sp. NBC_00683 TaxID=2903670 RepID=UPI002E311718|nr:S8 family serine peptidase [Streptomyces sp. NBC_00683]
MRRPFRQGSLPAVAVLTALLAAGLASPAGASSDDVPAVSVLKPSAVASSAHTVRLVTGDRVVVTGSGVDRQVSFAPDSDSPTGTASILQHGKDITVVPEEARPLLDSGVLDPRLFEVGALIEQGYADGRDLPLIVQNSIASAKSPANSRQVRRLPAIKATAAAVDPEQAQKFWAGLRDKQDGATAKRLADGVRKVWLDGKVTPTLDRSVPQIGAPTAWAAGYDGSGTKVAILDTGIDATHADLSDRIDEARNFSDSADAVDRHGHGTHVASTIAGSGAASGGKYKGVAPGAKLLIGKVLGDNGSGTESGVLAGMDWAAHSGAEVVSMSLGADTYTDGTDPMSQAVNTLTKDTGTLFVIAAGNTGPDAGTVGTPGAADAALTVAAVDDQDKIASFSSRGPRFGDKAMKPDIAAPGVNIVAARAAGTAMGAPAEAGYTSASGTSMATPHVSGAAAILAQEHPDWDAADLKGALMSSARTSGNGGFLEGSGRVDLATAIHAGVWATNASMGTYAQGAVSEPVTRTVTFHNTADKEITLALSGAFSLDGGSEVAGALTLGSTGVTLPAGGSRGVEVTVDPDLATTGGTYTGTITATGEGITAHATVALSRDLPTYKVGLQTLMPDGTAPSSAALSVYDLRKNAPPVRLPVDAAGVANARLKPGRYTILGHLLKSSASVTFVLPDVNVTDHDLAFTADGRKAARVLTKTPKPTEPVGSTVMVGRMSAEQSVGVLAALSGGPGHRYLLPSAAAQDGRLTSTAVESFRSRPISAKVQLPTGHVDLTTQFVGGSGRFEGVRKLTAVDAGFGTAEELAAHDVTGKLALVRLGSESPLTALTRVADAGAAAVMLVNSSDDVLTAGATTKTPMFTVPRSEGDRVLAAVARGRVTVQLTGELTPSYSYQTVNSHKGALPGSWTTAPAQSEFADVLTKDYSPAPAGAGELYSQGSWLGQNTVTGDGAGTFGEVNLGTTQHAYLLAANTTWSRTAYLSGYLSAQPYSSAAASYKPGSRSTQEWFKPVLHAGTPGPGADPSGSAQPYRKGDSMIVTIPKYVTGRSDVYEYGGRNADGDETAFRLYRNGTLLGSAPNAWVAVNNLPQEASQYRIETNAKRNNKWWSVSTEQHTAWNFTSAHVDGDAKAQLPLLQADYHLEGVALDSSVTAGKYHPVSVAFRNPDGTRAALTKGTVEVSYDEGTTWKKVPAVTYKGTVTGVLKAPKGSKGISLRIHGENSAGSSIDQTVIHAVHVR